MRCAAFVIDAHRSPRSTRIQNGSFNSLAEPSATRARLDGCGDRKHGLALCNYLAQDGSGRPFELATDGMLAVCIQHEMDHLIGKVFVDYLSPLKRARLAAKMGKKQRIAG